MKIIHFCASLQRWNGMANTARQFVAEEVAAGYDSRVTSDVEEICGAIDVVEIHGAWLPAVHKAAKRAKAIGAKLIIRPAGSYDPIRRRYHGWKKWLMAPWEHQMLRLADIVQATCPEEADWIRGYHHDAYVELTNLKRFFKIPSAVVSSYHERTKQEGNSPLRVFYLGRHHPLKGVRFLEQAIAEMGSACSLRIVSDHFGVDLEADWAWCDVLCLPTLSENFGRVVAEALERGKPVITTDGAPAWADLKPSQGIYLKGYRDGTDDERIRLLKETLARIWYNGRSF